MALCPVLSRAVVEDTAATDGAAEQSVHAAACIVARYGLYVVDALE